jgi:glutamate-1-semialdehyde 2,1-aminomutase
LPLAAFGGRADLMDNLSPLGPVYQAGTLSGNPLACAAGLALLRSLDAAVYDRLESLGARLEEKVQSGTKGTRTRFQRVGSMATLFFHPGPIRTFAEVDGCDREAYAALFRFLLERGHFLPPAQFEAFFLSTAHSEADVDRLAADLVEGVGKAVGTRGP